MSQASRGGGFFGNMFGGGQQPPPRQESQQQEQKPGAQGQQQEESQQEEELSEYAPLADLFAEDPPEEGDEEQDEDDGLEDDPANPGKKITSEQKLAGELQNMLKGFKITTEDFGADFDVNDPAKFAAAMTAVQRKAAVATMQMVLKPVQVALEKQTAVFQKQIEASLSNFSNQSTSKNALKELVPEVDDPELSGLINSLFTQAQKKAKNPVAAAQTVRKAIDAMGLKSKAVAKRTSDPFSGGSKLEGAAALDMFAPLKKK